ncbi:sensor histidine kinase [Crocosphaera sp. Alani8]|uniref:sensor histidine kinase n=1 Tax=Crocosphaera sp. Alani8 TaxID=3038952 RepID=UPI00313AE6A2
METKINQRTVALSEALETIKCNQNQLIKQEKLAFLGRLTAGFCHQFKNPLYQLKYGLATVNDMLNESQTKIKAQENQEEILDLVKSLQEPVGKLEMIFKLILLSPSQQKITFVEVSPNEFVEAILNSVIKYHSSPLLASQIKTCFSSELDQIKKIPHTLEIPLFNIIENALDVLDEAKKKKSNFVPNLAIKTEKKFNCWWVSIKDNGLGIDPSIENHLFEPFVTTKPETKCIGLGLYISQEVINKIGGEIIFKPLEKGVSFTLCIPCQKR